MAAPTPYTSSPTRNFSLSNFGSNDINSLLSGVKWGTSGIGGSATLYYSFPNSNSTSLWDQRKDAYTYQPGYEIYNGFQGLNSTQQDAATQLIQSWANVANLNIIKVDTESSSAVGDIRIAFTSDGYMDPYTYAYSYYPGPSYGGDIWINAIQPNASGDNYNPGGGGYHTLLHELGHSLGLSHPFDGIYKLSKNLDTYKYTVMSYSDSVNHQDWGGSSFYPTTPMLLDIKAIQYLYGANMSFHTGNDTYVFSDSLTYYETIWDAAGNDTIEYNATTGGTIDLTAGHFSILGKPIILDSGAIQYDNIAIAYNVTIENATGGSGDDTLLGNNTANTLTGNAGNDTLNGKAGADTMIGGIGDDTYYVDNKGDVITELVGEGNDTVNSIISYDLSVSGDNVENLTLLGSTALKATGNDLDNTIIGNNVSNILDGGLGADTMIGGKGGDKLYGGDGDDTLVGGIGNDLLTGGLGADTFVWELTDHGTYAVASVDKVTDFNISENDVLDLHDLLVDESIGADNLLNYLDITTSTKSGITSTEIRISTEGSFTNGNYSASHENAHITLIGTDLFLDTGTSTEAELIQNLITNNRLIVDS